MREVDDMDDEAREFAGLVAVVTGGSSGIGLATAHLLRRRGAEVVVVDRVVAPNDPSAYLCDIVDAAQVDETVARIAGEYGRIDILVNNAGIGAVGDVSENDDEEWRRVFDVNVFGTVRMSRAALPYLRSSPSAAIVNTCSIVAIIGVPQRALYASTKGAIAALTLAMAADHVEEGVRVNAVLPGTADTPWVNRLLQNSDDAAAAAESLRLRQPLGRLVAPAEVAHTITYLASPLARSTTGSLVTVDGGMGGIRVSTR